MAHSHGHDHSHSHGHAHGHVTTPPAGTPPGHHGHAHPTGHGRAFAVGITLNLLFVFTEAAYGWIANSLSLLADAGHNLGDVLGLALAWGATVLVRRAPTRQRTYGLSRSSILAALANGLLLIFASGAIALEAIFRLQAPPPVASNTIIVVAAIGIAVNGISAWLFHRGAQDDLNVRGAFLHLAADAAVSAGVVIAALVMRQTGWLWLDPLASLLISVVIVAGSWSLLRDSVNLVLDAVPAHIDPLAVEAYLSALPGVRQVHDLHIWAMSTTEAALTVHLVKPDAQVDDSLLARVHAELRERFGIGHSTVQFELGDRAHPCGQEGEDSL
jgi:cobalt-zinc-cadmium efflux system protein